MFEMSWTLLPPDVMRIIIQKLDLIDRVIFRCCSKRCRALCMASDPLLLDRIKNRLYFSVTRYLNLVKWLYGRQKIGLDEGQRNLVTLSAAEAGNVQVL